MLKEFDLDSVKRKFLDTIAYCKLFGNDDYTWVYISKITKYEDGVVHGSILREHPDFAYANPEGIFNVVIEDIKYCLPELRYYPVRHGENKFFGVPKKLFRKSFKVGLCHTDFRIVGPETKLTTLHVLFNTPLSIDPEEALAKGNGLLTPKILLVNNEIHFLGNRVGFRKKNQSIVHDWVTQEIRDGLKQINLSVI